MCVPVGASIRVNGLQYVRAPLTSGIGNVQRIDRSNDNVSASVSETMEDLQNNPFSNFAPPPLLVFIRRDIYSRVGFAYNDIIPCSNEAVIGRLISHLAAVLLGSHWTQAQA